ncbi:tudor domain-containing protein 3 [Sparganum proliferum]
MVATGLISPGWLVSDEYRKVLDGISSAADVQKHLVETDMREYGVSWLDSKKSKDVLIGEGQVLQVVRVRNIAISQAEEDFLTSSADEGARLLKLVLTDGKTNISALDMDNSPKLSIETWPGTKIRLTGRVPIRCGFLLLRQNNFEVLEGCVEQLYREWLLTKDARGGRRTRQVGPDAPPPFVPFGTADAAKLIASQNQFFSSLRASSNSESGPSARSPETALERWKKDVAEDEEWETAQTHHEAADNVRQEALSRRSSQASRGPRDRRIVACGSKDEADQVRSSRATLATTKTTPSNTSTPTTRANVGRYGHNYDEVDVLLYNLCLNIESAL